jgi:formylglycine-generating enzyme required for sulfatase activity
VVRGGGWDDFPEDLRSAYRDRFTADVANFSLGFRLARTL